MKTQINSLINGSENTVRDLANEKYAANPIGFYRDKNNVPEFGGTPTAQRKAIADKVGEENPGDLHINVRGVELTLNRHNSTSGKSWSWWNNITAQQYEVITGNQAPTWTHIGAVNTYGITILQDCTVEVSATSGKKGFSTTIGEEFVQIL